MATEKPERPSLSLIVPAYNEEGGVRAAVAANIKTLEASGIRHEIIVVNDGSTDATQRILEENFARRPGVKICSKPNGGFGSAVKMGIEKASLDYVTFAPVDNPLTPNLLGAFLARLGRADILVAYRLKRRGYSLRMRLNSQLYQTLVSKLFGLSLRDYNWIHLYPRSLFAPAGGIKISNDGIFMLAEVLIKAHWRGCSFCEFPVEMQERNMGVKTSATLRAAVRTATDLLGFYFKHPTGKE